MHVTLNDLSDTPTPPTPKTPASAAGPGLISRIYTLKWWQVLVGAVAVGASAAIIKGVTPKSRRTYRNP